MSEDERIARAYAEIDALNEADPETLLVDGTPQKRSVAYGRRMTAALESLDPTPSPALRIAVRGQHVGRFRLPRGSEPEGRVGYLRWRKRLAELHAELTGEAAARAGFDATTVERIRFLVQKKALHTDPETQTLEDCACLVFLRYEFSDFARRTEKAKMIDILRKTWGKMSERGHAAALALPLGEAEKALVVEALTPDPA